MAAGDLFRRRLLGLGCSLALALGGCGVQSPSTAVPVRSAHYARDSPVSNHIVEAGETVYHIAQVYGISTASLMSANGIDDPRELRVGQSLVIPASDSSGGRATASVYRSLDPWSVPRADRQFAWPVDAGVVSSPFGMRNGAMHDGVDISAPAGTAIHAADDGTVILSGRERGYGNLVILQHTGGYVTIYAHNQRNFVSQGDRIARGQKIAEIGASGRASGPLLHFEVRYANQAQNPLAYLPAPENSAGISFARAAGY